MWDEPWIDVLFKDGSNGILSLNEIFERASEIRDIYEELPIQDVSILRLLICIIHSSTKVTMKKWLRWFENKELPIAKIEQYKEAHYDEFYLFHPTHPFMQVADLTFADEDKSTLSNENMIYDYPTQDKIMRNRTEDSITQLSCAEAARLLVTAQNYDVCGVHTPMEGDIAKAGKAYPNLASLAHNTVIILEGNDLLDTLLLNTVPLNVPTLSTRKNEILDDDLPSWDVNNSSVNDVKGPRSSLSRQSRRIRLIPDFLLNCHDVVSTPKIVGAMVGKGEKISWNDMFIYEDMSIFRWVQDADDKNYYYKPSYFSKQPYKEIQSRIVGQAAFRAGEANSSNIKRYIGDKEHPDKLANNMYFAKWLLEEGVERFELDKMLSFRTVTTYYGPMEAIISRIDDDCTRVTPYSLTGIESDDICISMFRAIEHIGDIEYAYTVFLKNAEKICAPSSQLDANFDELNKMKIALEKTFQSWIEQDIINDSRDELWKQRVERVIRGIMDDYIDVNAHIKDFIGFCDEEGKEHSICKEEALFYYKVKKTLYGEGENGKTNRK